MNRVFIKLLLFPILLGFCTQLNASHIVGGEITYRCLGDNNFEISMTIYRDCFYGVPFFDNPASIGFFDEDNQLVTDVASNGQLFVFVRNNDTLSPVLENPCHVVPPDVCVHTTTYLDTVHLPFLEGGYQLVYQRCCRNETIVNIADPFFTGASYTANISETALLECNNSAEFKEWPPLYICLNERIEFDHSAIDPDGDSLVYRLCEPLSGVAFNNPRPQPPNNPPYDPVVWVGDPFSLTNMLGGDDSLQIDPHTGLLTGTPTIIGQFVVGICVDEYRDGELISTTFRDFQYNVGVCSETTSSFFAAENYCNQFELQFENLSDNAMGHFWVVGDLEEPYDPATGFEPVLSFPEEAGDYEVTLIAFGNTEACNDTFTRTISILDIDFEVEIGVERGECTDSIELDFSADILADLPGPNQFRWVVEWGNSSTIITDSIWSMEFSGVRTVNVDLRIINQEFGCWKVISEEIPTGLIFDDGASDYLFICSGTEVELYPDFDTFNTYIWSPEVGLLDPPDTPNPRAMPEENTIYTAEVINESCRGEVTVEVEIFDQDAFEEPDTICAVGQVTFTSPWGEDATSLNWQFFRGGSLFGTRTGDVVTFNFFSPGDWEVVLIDRDTTYPGCRPELTIPLHIVDLDVEIQAEWETGRCIDSLDAYFSAEIIGDFDPGQYLWIIEGDTFETAVPEFEYTFIGNAEIRAKVLIPNDLGCELSDEITIETGIEQEVFLFDSIEICRGDTIVLDAGHDGDHIWMPNTYFTTADTIPNPEVVPQSSIVYAAEVEVDSICTLFYEVDILTRGINLGLEDLIVCDTLDVFFELPDLDIVSYYWEVKDGDDILASDSSHIISFSVPDSGIYELEVIATDTLFGCVEIASAEIRVLESVLAEIEIETDLVGCLDTVEFALNAGPGDLPGVEYTWQISGDIDLILTGAEHLLTFEEGVFLQIELTATDSLGCRIVETTEVEVGLITADLITDTLEICLGDTVRLNPDFNPDYNYTWSPAFGFIDGITDPNPRVSPSETTLYTTRIVSGDCSVEKQVLVVVLPLPDITGISANPDRIVRFQESSGLLVEFNPPDSEVSWHPPDGLDDPGVANPEAMPDSTTTYTATITSPDGCVNSASVVLTVVDLPCETPYVFLPNAFSPNGDGENDVLYLRGVDIDRFELIIYNRWGQEVFRTTELDRGWDGTFKGEDQPTGAYGYYLDVECIGGDRFSRQGNVNLIR